MNRGNKNPERPMVITDYFRQLFMLNRTRSNALKHKTEDNILNERCVVSTRKRGLYMITKQPASR